MLSQQELHRIIDHALREDAPWGDITSDASIPADQYAVASFVARESGVLAGGAVLPATFMRIDSACRVDKPVDDGSPFAAGQILATVAGPTRAILQGERISLNLLQRGCGIATETRRYVDAVADTKARICDTRKTTPGLRLLEKAAVKSGGGHNHRFSLSDAVMIKDNHRAAWQLRGVDIAHGLQEVRSSVGHTVHIEIEVDDLATLREVLAAGLADSVLIDNFTLDDCRSAVLEVAGRCLVEASGGVNLATVADIAATGVDIISVGALTHSVRSIDIGLDIEGP